MASRAGGGGWWRSGNRHGEVKWYWNGGEPSSNSLWGHTRVSLQASMPQGNRGEFFQPGVGCAEFGGLAAPRVTASVLGREGGGDTLGLVGGQPEMSPSRGCNGGIVDDVVFALPRESFERALAVSPWVAAVFGATPVRPHQLLGRDECVAHRVADVRSGGAVGSVGLACKSSKFGVVLLFRARGSGEQVLVVGAGSLLQVAADSCVFAARTFELAHRDVGSGDLGAVQAEVVDVVAVGFVRSNDLPARSAGVALE